MYFYFMLFRMHSHLNAYVPIVQMMRVIKNRLMSKELQQAIDSVNGALNALEEKSSPNGSRYPALVNLLILSTLHQRKIVALAQKRVVSCPTWKESRKEQKHTARVLNDASRYMRFAACAYGFVVVKGLKILDKVGEGNVQETGIL